MEVIPATMAERLRQMVKDITRLDRRIASIPKPLDPTTLELPWSRVTEKPATFPPSAHTQAFGTITGTIADTQLPGRLRSVNPIGPGNDPNNLTATGWYAGYSWAGSLTGFGIAVLETQQYSPDWIVQTLTSIGPTPQVYTRTRYDGTTWSPWRLNDTGWVAWTPTMSQVTIGNGSVFGRYRRNGKTVEVFNRFTLGTSSAMGAYPVFALPFTAASPGNPISLSVEMLDSGSAYHLGTGVHNVTWVQMYFQQTAGASSSQVMAAITANTPFVWTSGDSISLRCIYETTE